MEAGGLPSQIVVAERSSGRAAHTRPKTEWTTAVDGWHAASGVVRLGFVVGVALTIIGLLLGAIPVSSGLAITVLLPAVLVDTQQHRLPDVWIVGAAIVLLVGVGISWSTGSMTPTPAGLIAGAGLMATPLLLLHLTSPTSMGFGDVKLAIVLGAAAGVADWQLAVPALALAAGTTATVGVCTRARHIAFGPGLVGGTLVALLARDLLVGPS